MSTIKGRIKQAGFTIVELLIVIVVIGILASITVVAYTGIQERASNAARLSAVKQMQQIVQLALLDHTPLEIRNTLTEDVNGWWRACFGTGHEDVGTLDVAGGTPDGIGDCGWYGDKPYVSESTEFNALIQESVSGLSMASYPTSSSTDGDNVSGPYLGTAWVDSAYDKMVIEYQLEGEGQDCGFSPLVYTGGGVTTMTPIDDPSYSSTGAGITDCILVVVDEPNFY